MRQSKSLKTSYRSVCCLNWTSGLVLSKNLSVSSAQISMLKAVSARSRLAYLHDTLLIKFSKPLKSQKATRTLPQAFCAIRYS